MTSPVPPLDKALPSHYDLFYGGSWHRPMDEMVREIVNPGTGQGIAHVGQATAVDVDAAVQAAQAAFTSWRRTSGRERAGLLRQAAAVLREHGAELALLDALDTGNPVAETIKDAAAAAASLDYYAGLTPMLRGETLPGPESADEYLHYTVREPCGVVARIVASNHPLMFAGAKLAAPLAAGNTVIVKPPDQAPLAALRLAELLGDIFPRGVVNFLPGGPDCGRALTTHAGVAVVTLIGSVPTAKAIQRAASHTLKPTLLELGGKNALIGFPDAHLDTLVDGVARGMNFTWAGQSCGSLSRVFLHESLHDEVLARVVQLVAQRYRPGDPTDAATTMGALIDRAAQDRVRDHIASAQAEGAQLVCGGADLPAGLDPRLAGGFFVAPTIFANVQPHMRIAQDEIFGPVMAVFRWRDEADMLRTVNSTAYGLTTAIFTRDLVTTQRAIRAIDAGFVWVNTVGKHFQNVPFGGMKESGLGREEGLEELLAFTVTKSVNISLV
ncbi:putative aldehdye dehydrogenase [Dactylonectria macrodidyma]|uniref:aldehyde dehydrogenase (NAD(+)) n=1 Tax=Dactylonectria macrodidyma TaxID=307937 RepID=A0A9P9DTN7_9HYPO|nr:putative aldehdye dehydrogenase [Dactylonectria macrodidyma]